MKSLNEFLQEGVNSIEVISMNRIVGGIVPSDTWKECYEDTYTRTGCDQYIEVSDDNGKYISSNEVTIKCDPV